MFTTNTTSDKASNVGTTSTPESTLSRQARREAKHKWQKAAEYANKGYSARKIARMLGAIDVNHTEKIIKDAFNI